MGKQIRSLEVSETLLKACDVGPIVRSFARAEREQPGRVPELRGTTLLMFPCLDSDVRANYLIPEVRSFIQELYRQLPHFFYYLHPEPALGAVGMHSLCLMAMSDLTIQGNSAMPKSYALLAQLMLERLKPAVAFARRIGDSPDEFVSSYRSCIPDEHWSSVRTQVLAG